MNKFKYYFILLLAGISLVSCNKSDDDEVEVTPVRDYAEQYKADNDSIVNYLKTNYIQEVTANFDVKIAKIPAGGAQVSIWDQQDYPLQQRDVYNDDITYKVYYLTLNKGVGLSPTNTDKVVTSYSGTLLNNTVFDSSNRFVALLFPYDAITAEASTVIDGWSEIFPQFKTGTSTTSSDGVITYSNFGAGVMFLPSGLAYYATGSGSAIPAYTCVTFSFKLYDLQHLDHDQDGVFDYQEDVADVNGKKDGYMYDFRDTVKYPNPPANLVDDTDKDGIADFMDYDDDGDGYTTRFEITKPTGATYSGVSKYYPYDPVLDNPNTPNTDESEIWGIPRRPTGALADPTKPESVTNSKAFVPADYTDPARLRMHLDKTYPYQKN
jgi:FKBP-type peptidyl-prolyl cis-trans isomerase FkpA